MNTSINIKMKSPDNKDLQKSITYVNPEATSEDFKLMAKGLVSLTSNEYESTDRIQKVNVDTESIPGAGTDQPITIGAFETVAPQFVEGEWTYAFKASISGAEGSLASSGVVVYYGTEDERDSPREGYTFSTINESGNELRVEFKPEDDEEGFVVFSFEGFVVAWSQNVSGSGYYIHYLPTCVEFRYSDE